MRIYRFIDASPEVPYFLMGAAYTATHPGWVSIHVFSLAFLFLFSSIVAGLALKAALRTKRPRAYECLPLMGYDIPSLHAIVSVGAVAFLYFVSLGYCVLSIPICAAYMHSRISLGIHTKKAVGIGAAMGLVLGLLFGMNLQSWDFGSYEPIFAASFFCIPAMGAVFNTKSKKSCISEGACRQEEGGLGIRKPHKGRF